MENKKELNANVTRSDVLSFVEHLKRKALVSIRQENETERLFLQRKLFWDKSTSAQIEELATCCANIEDLVKSLNGRVSKNHSKHKVRYGSYLSVLNSDNNSNDDLEVRYLSLLSHPELSELKEVHSKKITETELAYRTIIGTLKGMRSASKMGEYLLATGFDISKIEAKTPVPKESIKPVFTKEVLFPCLKD